MAMTVDLKEKFRDVLKQSYHQHRHSYFYATSVTVSCLDVSITAFLPVWIVGHESYRDDA
jgi:hypothetical protein